MAALISRADVAIATAQGSRPFPLFEPPRQTLRTMRAASDARLTKGLCLRGVLSPKRRMVLTTIPQLEAGMIFGKFDPIWNRTRVRLQYRNSTKRANR